MNIKLHPKYGLNPTIPTCFFCGGEKNEIALLGASSKKITGQDEAPMKGPVLNMEPCDKCKELMKQGIMLISVRDGDEGSPNPYRTGHIWVIKQEIAERIFSGHDFSKERYFFIEDRLAKKIRLPFGEDDHENNPETLTRDQ